MDREYVCSDRHRMKVTLRSKVWNHFVRPPGTENRGECRYCHALISTAGGSTGNLARHLKLKHFAIPFENSNESLLSTITDEEATEEALECEEIPNGMDINLPEAAEDVSNTNAEAEERIQSPNKTKRAHIAHVVVEKRLKSRTKMPKIYTTHVGASNRLLLPEPAPRTVFSGIQQKQLPVKKPHEYVAQIRDEYSVFGEYVANELRSLKNDLNCTIAKKKIQDALFELKMASLQGNSNVSASDTTSSNLHSRDQQALFIVPEISTSLSETNKHVLSVPVISNVFDTSTSKDHEYSTNENS